MGLEQRIEALESRRAAVDEAAGDEVLLEVWDRLRGVANRFLERGLENVTPDSEAEKLSYRMAEVYRDTEDLNAVMQVALEGVQSWYYARVRREHEGRVRTA
jgi:hypothetical protein